MRTKKGTSDLKLGLYKTFVGALSIILLTTPVIVVLSNTSHLNYAKFGQSHLAIAWQKFVSPFQLQEVAYSEDMVNFNSSIPSDLNEMIYPDFWTPVNIINLFIMKLIYTRSLLQEFWNWVGPGGLLHPSAFLDRFHGHYVIEILLIVTIGYLLLHSRSVRSSKASKPLTEKEIDTLCDEWVPEPLCDSVKSVPHCPVITSMPCSANRPHCVADGKNVLNFSTYDIYNFSASNNILEECQSVISKYGVGSCGPRGFYGTIDVHLELEDRLAAFMKKKGAIIYAYDMVTLPSVLPAFANVRDLIIIDENVEFSIQIASNLSRSKVVFFKHNDMEDLEQVIVRELDAHAKSGKPLNRRYIVVEGLYKLSADIAPLDKIKVLKHKYKFRLIVDESMCVGVLGQTGRGACEMFGLGDSDVDIVCASLGTAIASQGGFCVGDLDVIDHQRLSGLGYCFSASLPPFLATASILAIDYLDSDEFQSAQQRLLQNASILHEVMQDTGLHLVKGPKDVRLPLCHLELPDFYEDKFNINNPEFGELTDAYDVLNAIVQLALKNGNVLFSVFKKSILDSSKCKPFIRVVVTVGHTAEEINSAKSVLKSSVESVLCKISEHLE